MKIPTNIQVTKLWLCSALTRNNDSPMKKRLTTLKPISDGECSFRTRLAISMTILRKKSEIIRSLSRSPLFLS